TAQGSVPCVSESFLHFLVCWSLKSPRFSAKAHYLDAMIQLKQHIHKGKMSVIATEIHACPLMSDPIHSVRSALLDLGDTCREIHLRCAGHIRTQAGRYPAGPRSCRDSWPPSSGTHPGRDRRSRRASEGRLCSWSNTTPVFRNESACPKGTAIDQGIRVRLTVRLRREQGYPYPCRSLGFQAVRQK